MQADYQRRRPARNRDSDNLLTRAPPPGKLPCLGAPSRTGCSLLHPGGQVLLQLVRALCLDQHLVITMKPGAPEQSANSPRHLPDLPIRPALPERSPRPVGAASPLISHLMTPWQVVVVGPPSGSSRARTDGRNAASDRPMVHRDVSVSSSTQTPLPVAVSRTPHLSARASMSTKPKPDSSRRQGLVAMADSGWRRGPPPADTCRRLPARPLAPGRRWRTARRC